MGYQRKLLRRREMSGSLHPYSFWQEDGKYFFDTPSGARYVAYFLDLSSFAEHLYTFNFDRIRERQRDIADSHVFDTICSILEGFFVKHRNALLLVCDSIDGHEAARMRLFDSWFHRIAPLGLLKIDRKGVAETYNLLVSFLIWDDNPDKDYLVAKLDEYCSAMLELMP